MPSILAAPANLPPSPVAAETRMVHDVATLKPSDYRAADGASWVISTVTPAADSGTNVTGTSAIIGAVVPIPFIARVQAAACDRMAAQLRTFFTEGDASSAEGAPAVPVKTSSASKGTSQ